MSKHSTKVRCVCHRCGVEFFLFPSVLKKPYAGRFCSRSCAAKARVNNRTIESRFFGKVEKTDSCWMWLGSVNNNGYGQIHITVSIGEPERFGRSSRSTILTHRLSWELVNGAIPDGLEVLHNCPDGDNPRCVNPSHLWLGTQADNMRDAMNKGRTARGQDKPTSKLTDETVTTIRYRYATGSVTQQQLADEHEVTISVICQIVNRKSWKHVTA